MPLRPAAAGRVFPSDASVSPEAGHHAEPRASGHKWFDIAIAVCILLVSVSSLIVAIVHSQTLEKMADANARLVEANSWPFLAYGTGEYTDDIELAVRNEGVGPAKIETVELVWNGVAYPDPISFLAACCGSSLKYGDLGTSLVAGRVLRAGDSIDFLVVPKARTDGTLMTRLNVARLSPKLSVNVCYCSVFDECWAEDLVRMSLRPRHVDRCTPPRVPYTLRP